MLKLTRALGLFGGENRGSGSQDQREILDELFHFYQELYTANPEVKFTFLNETNIKLTDEEKEYDRPFTFGEFQASLYVMASSKTPGTDGLLKEFYVVFFSKIGEHLWNAMLELYENRISYPSEREITLAS